MTRSCQGCARMVCHGRARLPGRRPRSRRRLRRRHGRHARAVRPLARGRLRLPGRAHEALVLNRPDVIEGVHALDGRGRRRGASRPTPSRPRASSSTSGASPTTRVEINRQAAEIARKAVGEDRFVAGSIGPTGLPARLRRPDARRRSRFRELVDGLRRAGRGPDRGRRRPAHHRDRAGHPRGQGRDLRRARGVQAAPAARCRSRPRSRCCPTAARCCWAPTSTRVADDARGARRSTSSA